MFKPTETQRMHKDRLSSLKESINWDRVFYNTGIETFLANGKPGSAHCNFRDLEEFKKYSDMLKQHPDSYTVYKFHTHENGDQAVHKLDIEFHPTGYEELVTQGEPK